MITNQGQTETISEKIEAFLCHSSDDKTAVRDLYQRLLDDGFRPWLDEKELLPGQDWEHETTVALRSSNAVIVCLSRHSITKRGYAQKEIKRALDLADEQPLGSIFLIPLRLEPCDIPDQLSKWQWVDYFEEDGYEKLKRALDIGHSSKAGAYISFQRSSATEHSPVKSFIPGAKSKPLPQIVPFALISLVSFLLGTMLLFFLVWKAEKLVALGLTGRLYYIVLLPLGLSVAGFLFGVLQSYAIYHGHRTGGTLILGGPIVAFCLVVIFGFVLVPDLSPFSVTIYVHGTSGLQDIVLKNSGEVLMDLAGKRERVQIGDAGQAYFPMIAANFRAQEVPISVSSDKFESIQSKIKLDASSVYLGVQRKAGRFYGRIKSEERYCQVGAQVFIGGQPIPFDPVSGWFDVMIPGDKLGDDLVLEARAPGCDSIAFHVFADSTEIPVNLQKSSAIAKPRKE